MEETEKRLEDYVLVFVNYAKLLQVPPVVSFTYIDPEVFVGPNSSSSVHKRVPDVVVDFFRVNREKKLFVSDGWEWFLRGYADSGYYTRSQDRRTMVFDAISPYANKLRGFEKKVVAVSELLPPFERNNSAFDIAQTGFQLMLVEKARVVDVVVAEVDRGFGKLKDVASVVQFEYKPI